jgi:GTP-binding protein
MFRDVVTLRVHAGHGGRGCVSFRREKYVPYGGPNGGDGGDGGSVFIRCQPGVNHLGHLRNNQAFRAQRGQHGQGNDKHGRRGEDIEIVVPPGTVVFDADTDEPVIDLADPEVRWCAAKGGRGGKGNARFATATRQAPRFAQPGLPGVECRLRLELKLIAGIGLIGRPNAGKTTLLRALTGSHGKVGAYPFTTLTPNLGVIDLGGFERAVIADVPGLITGAHRGEGLGLTFLRHTERTRALAVLADAAAIDGDPVEHYRELCEELRHYRPELLERPRMLVANKIDLEPDAERLASLRSLATAEGITYCEISAADSSGLETVVDWIREQSHAAEAAEA